MTTKNRNIKTIARSVKDVIRVGNELNIAYQREAKSNRVYDSSTNSIKRRGALVVASAVIARATKRAAVAAARAAARAATRTVTRAITRAVARAVTIAEAKPESTGTGAQDQQQEQSIP